MTGTAYPPDSTVIWGDLYGLLIASVGEAMEAGRAETARALAEGARILRESEDLGQAVRTAAATPLGGYLAEIFLQAEAAGDAVAAAATRLLNQGDTWAGAAAAKLAEIVEKGTTAAGLGLGFAVPFAALALGLWLAARRR